MSTPVLGFALFFLAVLVGAQDSPRAPASASSKATLGTSQKNYAWMASFSGRHAYDLYKDPRFKSSVWAGFPHDDVYWMSGAHGRSLPAGIVYFALGGFYTYPKDDVRQTGAGGIVVDGYLDGSADASKWLFWSNASSSRGEMIFAFVSRSQAPGKQNTGALDVYTGRYANLLPLPDDFVSSMKTWENKIGITGFNRATVHGVGISQPMTGP
jgi:hypothetical protein